MQSTTHAEVDLNRELLTQPSIFDNRFTPAADCHLRQILFKSLAGQREDWLRLFFPNGTPANPSEPWSLRTAQGAVDGAEYTAAAKGTACGHIFKNGESTYHCKTCEADETCVLCSKCFESSDHEGHMVLISVSPGNSGCCDCGDPEAWKREVRCSIHTADTEASLNTGKSSGKEKEKAPAGSLGSQLPADLVWRIRMTIARSVDYLCDVFSCSPEQLRLPKSVTSIMQDERLSRLSSVYGEEPIEEHPEFALVLWNDEKHTVDDVQNQVARACARSKRFGFEKAMEVNDIGRSVVQYSRNVSELLGMAEIIEQLKVTVTIRSSRDTFREHMCATIIDWISDIANCAVGNEPYLLRNIVCEELLNPWRTGSQASNKDIGQAGIDDHETEDNDKLRRRYRAWMQPLRPAANVVRVEVEVDDTTNDDDDDDDNEDDEEYDEDYDDMEIEDDGMEIEIDDVRAANLAGIPTVDAADMDIDILDEPDDVTEALEATLGGYPPPPPPPPRGARRRILTPADSDDGEPEQARPTSDGPYENVPRTPKAVKIKRFRPSKHWLEKPEAFKAPRPSEPREDLWQRVRLDKLIQYDLRLWKILRIHLRHLYITTVVTIPHFKRILGLRFAGLYTALAQLYLIADREPDHSIINLSVQMLTTPTITQEVVERGNFLTNLMAILYTFITTRQVGFPEDVNMRATLAFDAGAVTNRRMFHFFMDLRWLFQSEFVHYKLRFEPRYLLQFLDLVKLHQGVCPNVRATGEHVEYESDAWISASMIVKEVNKLCKQLAVAFEPGSKFDDGNANLQRAIRTVAQVTMINAFGYERKRFHAAENKDDLEWHSIGPFELSGKEYSVPHHIVQLEPMSFHHPLHYLLSWLLENGKSFSRQEMRTLLHFAPGDLKDPWNVTKMTPAPSNLTSDELLVAIFDHPLRVCAWLAQMKAGMWVRNGITLRHQAHTYRSVSHRDVGYQRDIVMIQAGLVLCGAEEEKPGERFLAQMINRWQLDEWVVGRFDLIPGFEESQQLDVIEDFFHLLVVALSERGNLLPSINEKDQHDKVLQHDIAHALCFKPLSFSELAGRVTEKVGESDDFSRVLESMTTYRPPEGLSDTGTFELKPEFIELVDPYYAHYSRNHREEAENVYKKHMAKKTGKKAEDMVYEPRLEKIEDGMFADLASFTKTPLFIQLLGAALHFAATADRVAPKIQATRIETFLHMVLHLTLLAVIEEKNSAATDGLFSKLASSPTCAFQVEEEVDGNKLFTFDTPTSLVKLLVDNTAKSEYASCHPAIQHILRQIQYQQPDNVAAAVPGGFLLDRSATDSPASLPTEEKERKKQEALARQAKVMAQMKQQQNNFLQNQGLSSFDDEFDDFEDDMSIIGETDGMEVRKTWSFPTGNCILCQEETDDQRLYGTFAFLGESDILRSTPIEDSDYVKEVFNTPTNLDRSAENIRPFGVAGDNKREVRKVASDGKTISTERQGLSKGFPHQKEGIKGPVATSCGHIMHFNCFELYLAATNRRHAQQIARNHPERIDFKEFVCPLCKALGNTFLPIIWKAKDCSPAYELHAAQNFDDWLLDIDERYPVDVMSMVDPARSSTARCQQVHDYHSNRSFQYVTNMFAPSLIQQNMQDLSLENSPTSPLERRFPARAGHALSRLASLGMGGHGVGGIQSPFAGPDQGLPSDPPSRLLDLWSAYRRVEDSIKVNKLSPPVTDTGAVNPVAALSRSLGMSIASFEITYRGVCTDPTARSLLADLPSQALTHLRIISETIESYLAINVMQSGSNAVVRETVKKRDIMTAQLFGSEHESSVLALKTIYGKFLFQDDIFLFFSDWMSLMAPTVAEAASVLQLCYWAEIVKAVFVLCPVVANQKGVKAEGNTETRRLREVIIAIGMDFEDEDEQLKDRHTGVLHVLLEKYALTFLRKCTVLMLVRYGLEFECPYDLDTEAPELQRLTAMLHLPRNVDDMCSVYLSDSVAGAKLRSITADWLHQAMFVCHSESMAPSRVTPSINVPHPAIFELVGLPMNYDVLTEEAIRRRCPTTGKELYDPAVCLLCGEIFCSQAFCCMKDKSFGGCYQHLKRHGTQVGVFINIRKCMVLFSHGGDSGSWAQAPYLDKHGEPDPTLRRHHQLYLNQKRYGKLLRDVWLNHMIPSVISRKLEGDINPGGWETL